MRIGFLGLGQMGGPMAERLAASEHRLTVFDPNGAARDRLVALGAGAALTARDACEGADLVFACLPNPRVSLGVLDGPDGVIAGAPRTYIETSTIGSAAIDAIGAALPPQTGFLDAPVSGGPRGARAGSLTAMVAGAPETFARAESALRLIAGNVYHLGPTPGQGQVAKLANNMISAAGMVASFEAVVMGVKAGLDAATLIDLINHSTGRCGATLDKFPASILPRTFDYGGKLGTMYKDVMLCLEEYRARGVPHHGSAAAAQIWFQGMAAGWENEDYTTLIKLIEGWAGVEVRGPAAHV
ncbi:MAG: NAD(P)-dependent oxidoreductase [Jannaschia sp.]